MLQLQTHRGLCTLIRLCRLKRVPQELKNLLEDHTIIKVGIQPLHDAKYLREDYGVSVAGTLDLRHLAKLHEPKPGGLAKLAEKYLNIEMDKSWFIAASDWENVKLDDKQIEYAALDAHVAIELYKHFENLGVDQQGLNFDCYCRMHIDVPF